MNKISTASLFLTCVGAIGVVATSIATAKATPKAALLLEKAEEEKGEELTVIEKIKTAGPVYIPAAVIGISTIACIFSINILNKRAQASIASAYAVLDNAYKEYRNKVKEIYGEEADQKIVEEVVKNQCEEYDEEVPEGEQLFYDLNSMQYFTSTVDQVLQKTVTDDGLECYIISTPFDTLPAPFVSW